MSESAGNASGTTVGTLVFDSHANIVQYGGVGEQRTADAQQLALVALDADGYGAVEDAAAGLRIALYRQGDLTVASYSRVAT